MKRKTFKIISGGQTGADRAALDWAIEHGIAHGGWCPKGRKAEDGPIDPGYQLKETPGSHYVQRTEWNARDSDGTVVFSIASVLTGSSKKTLDLARQHHKPVLHLWRDGGLSSPEQALRRFIRDNDIKVLNVAGPRASKEPEVAAFVTQVLEKALRSSGESCKVEVSEAPAHHQHRPHLDAASVAAQEQVLGTSAVWAVRWRTAQKLGPS